MMKLQRWATRYYRNGKLVNETFHYTKLGARYTVWKFNHYSNSRSTKFVYVKVK